MNARAGHYGGERDNRGGYRDRWERDSSRRHGRQVVRRELRDIHRRVRLQGIQAAGDR
jgi:hypothetical protein